MAESGNKDWATLDPSMYVDCFSSQAKKPTGWCTYCHSLDHSEENCPLQPPPLLNGPNQVQATNQPKATSQPNHLTPNKNIATITTEGPSTNMVSKDVGTCSPAYLWNRKKAEAPTPSPRHILRPSNLT